MHHFFLFPDAQKNGGKTVWKCGGIGKKSSFSSTFFNFVFPDEKCPFKNETMHGSELSALCPPKIPPRGRGGPRFPSCLRRARAMGRCYREEGGFFSNSTHGVVIGENFFGFVNAFKETLVVCHTATLH